VAFPLVEAEATRRFKGYCRRALRAVNSSQERMHARNSVSLIAGKCSGTDYAKTRLHLRQHLFVRRKTELAELKRGQSIEGPVLIAEIDEIRV